MGRCWGPAVSDVCGRVINPAGERLNGVELSLTSESDSATFAVESDGVGSFSFCTGSQGRLYVARHGSPLPRCCAANPYLPQAATNPAQEESSLHSVLMYVIQAFELRAQISDSVLVAVAKSAITRSEG